MTTKNFGMGFCGRRKCRNRMHGKIMEDQFTVESMDKRCLEWIKKTPEEKEEFINQRKEIYKG